MKVNLTEKNKKLIHLVSGSLILAMIAVCGVLFAVSCYTINKQGVNPFNYDSISAEFAKFDIVVYITLFLVVCGGTLSVLMPLEGSKLKADKNERVICTRLADKVDISEIKQEDADSIKKQRTLRKILTYINIALFALEAVLPLIYLLNPNLYKNESVSNEVLHGILFYCICLLPLAVYEIAYMYITEYSYRRESAMLKEAVKTYGAKSGMNEVNEPSVIDKTRNFLTENNKPIVLGVRIAVIGAASLFIILGAVGGGMNDVLIKAINICKECIGIG